MRVLLLISNVVIGAALLTSMGSSYAAKANKQHHVKGKRHLQVTKKNTDPSDVWRKISTGLQLPRPDLELAALADQANEDKYRYLQAATMVTKAASLTAPAPRPKYLYRSIGTPPLDPSATTSKDDNLLKPAKELLPKDKYTALGRKILSHTSAKSAGDCEPDKKPSRLETIKAIKTARIRTQFNFHPELQKHTTFNAKTVAYQEPAAQAPCVENNLKMVNFARPVPAVLETSTPSVAMTTQAQQSVEAEMQVLAAKQREQEVQRSTKLMMNHERVNKFVGWYAQRRYYLYEVAERAKPYLYHIVDSLNKHHLPLDLALLPIVESAYQPTALSPKSAAGLWQFVPSTGADYNLKQDNYYDDRLDITASTQAAVSYLAFLNQRFKGDWLLALAAYNCGIGRVEEAMSRNLADGLDTDYWSLQLPQETQDYVPRLLALAVLLANPTEHKLNLTPIRDEPYFVKVTIDRKTDIDNLADKDLKTIAEFANVPYEHFKLLNPGYLDPSSLLPTNRMISLLMPIPNANELYERLSMLAKMEGQAQKASPSFSIVKSVVNTVTEQDLSMPWGQQPNYVSLPLPPEPPSHEAVPKEQSKPPKQEKYATVHYVDKGESLHTIARRFDVSVEALRALNNLKHRQGVTLAQRLVIPHPQQPKTIMLEAHNNDNKAASNTSNKS